MSNSDKWTLAEVMASMQKLFAGRGIETARLDSELLLAHVLGVSRVHLYTHYDQPLTTAERERLRILTRRRLACEPIAYLLGRKEFFSRTFEVTPATLIPRPETEHIIEVVLRRLTAANIERPRILDLGTGSGILAITLALEFPEAQVVATDLSSPALEVAKRNAATLAPDRPISFLQGDFYAAVLREEPFDVIVSNPPYVAKSEMASLPRDVVDFEPKMALFSEDEGCLALRTVIENAHTYTRGKALTVVEMDAAQRKIVTDAFALHHEAIEIESDLAGLARVVSGCSRLTPSQ